MGNLIRKVFSPKLAKSYWIAKFAAHAQNGLPVFSEAEAKWIGAQNLKADELEFVYNARLADIDYQILPDPPKVEVPVDPKAEAARVEFFDHVQKTFGKKKKEKDPLDF